MVKCLENTKCEATRENLDKLLKLVSNTVSSYKQALYYEAYFYVKDDILNWGHKDCIDPIYWNMFDTIHLVNGQFQYVEETSVKEKPKNNFNYYGFEADFEGEILKEVQEKRGINYLGYFIGKNGTYYPCLWNLFGKVWKTSVKDEFKDIYNLKPIKKEWYENPDNFPCLITNGKIVEKAERFDSITQRFYFRNVMYSNISNGWRPLTKEEVLSLLIKEE